MLPLTLIITIAIIYLINRKPSPASIKNLFQKPNNIKTIDDKYNHEKVIRQGEIDRFLDKIHKKGYDNLTQEERNKLDELSK